MKLLEVGEKAPNFEGQDQNDSNVSSNDFKEIAFFNKRVH